MTDKSIKKQEKKEAVNFFIKLNQLTNNDNAIANRVIKVLKGVK